MSVVAIGDPGRHVVTVRFRAVDAAAMIAAMIVTIDGPAGSGKSTAARKLAARLELPYLDTGAMYRALAHAALSRGVDLRDAAALVALARQVELEVDCGPTHTRVRVDGHDVSEAIRTMAVSAATSAVAKTPAIREILVEHQRRIGAALQHFVSEGRDQGTTVFPEADFKFVLDASLEKRADRRHRELEADGEEVPLQDVMRSLADRDRVDARHWEPLIKAGKAIVLDTTCMTIQEVVERLAGYLRRAPSDKN